MFVLLVFELGVPEVLLLGVPEVIAVFPSTPPVSRPILPVLEGEFPV